MPLPPPVMTATLPARSKRGLTALIAPSLDAVLLLHGGDEPFGLELVDEREVEEIHRVVATGLQADRLELGEHALCALDRRGEIARRRRDVVAPGGVDHLRIVGLEALGDHLLGPLLVYERFLGALDIGLEEARDIVGMLLE